jgi:hypothetical protein
MAWDPELGRILVVRAAEGHDDLRRHLVPRGARPCVRSGGGGARACRRSPARAT